MLYLQSLEAFDRDPGSAGDKLQEERLELLAAHREEGEAAADGLCLDQINGRQSYGMVRKGCDSNHMHAWSHIKLCLE